MDGSLPRCSDRDKGPARADGVRRSWDARPRFAETGAARPTSDFRRTSGCLPRLQSPAGVLGNRPRCRPETMACGWTLTRGCGGAIGFATGSPRPISPSTPFRIGLHPAIPGRGIAPPGLPDWDAGDTAHAGLGKVPAFPRRNSTDWSDARSIAAKPRCRNGTAALSWRHRAEFSNPNLGAGAWHGEASACAAASGQLRD